MTRAEFFKHFELLAGQDDAIPKMRELVLELAIRGKLVSHNTKRDTDTEWLNFCAKFSIPTNGYEPAFKLPAHWLWARLENVATSCGQKKPDAKFSYVDVGSIDNVRGVIKQDVAVLEAKDAPSRARKLVTQNSVIYSTVRPYLKNIAIIDRKFSPSAIVSTAFAVLNPNNFLNPRYLFYWLRSRSLQVDVESKMKGVAYPAISDSEFWKCRIPVPPPSEQQRIVVKAEELMLLCDGLEEQEQIQRKSRERLTHSAFHHLTFAKDSKEFHHRFDFILHNSSLVLDDVSQLRQTILQLAVQGRLDSSSKIWPSKPKRLGEVAPIQNGYAFKSEWFVANGIRLLRNANVGHDELRWNDAECIEKNRAREYDRFALAESDVVLSLDRPFISTGTKVARVRHADLPCLLLQRVGRFQPDLNQIHPDYLFLWLSSPHFTSQIDPGRSNGVPHISSKQVEAAEIFVPPLAEQKRVVARVEELMRLCDQLEEQLDQSHAVGSRLLDAAVHHLLAE